MPDNTPSWGEAVNAAISRSFRRFYLMVNGPVPADLLYLSDPEIEPQDVIENELKAALNQAVKELVLASKPENFNDTSSKYVEGYLDASDEFQANIIKAIEGKS